MPCTMAVSASVLSARAVSASTKPATGAACPRAAVPARAAASSPAPRRARLSLAPQGSKRAQRWRGVAAAADAEAAPGMPAGGLPARDDDVLPDSLLDSVIQAGEATAKALRDGKGRCTAELLIPELWDISSGPVMAEEGDQMRWWELAREFVAQVGEAYGRGPVRAVFPDAGVSAMLNARWGTGVPFGLASLDDQSPLSEDDGLIVITCPDPPSLDRTKRLCEKAAEKGIPVVMFNPRLASGDVGIGVNVRDMRINFLSTFTIAYSIYPLSMPSGSVFKKYPARWQVFLEEENNPGRYELVCERDNRPAGQDLDDILDGIIDGEMEEEGGVPREKTPKEQLTSYIRDMQRFMKALK